MTLERTLLLSLALSAVACGDDGTLTTTGDSEASSSSGGDATTEPPTTMTTPTTSSDPTTSTSDPTTTTTVGPSTDTTDTTTTDATTDTTDTTGTDSDTSTGTDSDTTTGTDTTGTDTSTGTTSPDTDTDTGTDTTDTGTETGDEAVEIYPIQDGTLQEGADVLVDGVIVTAKATSGSGMFVQEPDGGQFSGLWVFVGDIDISGLAVGDEVDVSGVIEEFNGLTEINASMGSVTPTGVKGVVIAPEPLAIGVLTDPVQAEPWEGVHVSIMGAPLTVSALLPGDEFQVSDGDPAVVDNLAYSVSMDDANFPQFQVDATFTSVAGPLNFSVNTYKLVPRSAADLTGYQPPADPKLTVDDLVAGDLIITEIMYNPTCLNDVCEWIELFNAAAQPIELNGLVIQDSAQNPNAQGKINTSAVVEPGEYVILGFRSMTDWPYPNPPAAFYGNAPALGNNTDQVFLKNSMITIDKSPAYMGQGGADQGVSWKLDPTKIDDIANDDAANWCYSSVTFYKNPNTNQDEFGSPNAANEAACKML
jgi:hypothetical protein